MPVHNADIAAVLEQIADLHEIKGENGGASGEPWRTGLDRGFEVKGATLTALSVRKLPGGWEARCVVDVGSLIQVKNAFAGSATLCSTGGPAASRPDPGLARSGT